MAELLQEYELSVWEDVHQTIENDETGLGNFGEKKIAVIGSHNLHTPTKAYNVSLKENINGEKTLTFSLPRAYRDKDGELKDNPFLSFLTAERKLKLRDGAEYDFFDGNGKFDPSKLSEEDKEERWTDYVIKTIDEDKESFVNNYTCKEVYVNELGKNGWSITLDSELKNNYGTLPELAERVLEGSGWTVDKDSYVPMEKIAEPLFWIKITGTPVEATSMVYKNVETISGYVYTFYSQLQATAEGTWRIKDGLDKVQILWNGGNSFENHQLDDNRQIIDEEDKYNYLVDRKLLATLEWQPTGVATDNVNAIQGGRIVESIYSHYEPVADKYVEEYSIKEDADVGLPDGIFPDAPVYHYTETEYLTSDIVKNYIVNASSYTALTGWKPDQNGPTIQTWAYDDGKDTTAAPTDDSIDKSINYLVIPHDRTIYNTGLKYNDFFLEPDRQYMVRIKARAMSVTSGRTATEVGSRLSLRLAYETTSGPIDLTQRLTINDADNTFTLFNTGENIGYPLFIHEGEEESRPAAKNGIWIDNENYYCCLLTTISSIQNAYGKEVGFYITDSNSSSMGSYCWHIEDIQLFDYVTDENGIPIYPGDIPTAKAITTDHFYTISLENGREIAMPLSANKDNYVPRYNANYSAVRHIDIKESNYFNNINSLAELFGTWVKFKVKHQKNGQLIVEDNVPKKTVKFTRFASEDDEINWAGFKYGINLKSIKRNVESTAIASKVIVKNNNNEFAPAGMSSIARAIDNPTGENVIYNFDYYVAHGLLDQSAVINDLYGTASAHFGYYHKLRELNDKLLPVNEELTEMQGALENAKQLLEYSEVQYKSANEDYNMQHTYYEQDKAIYAGSDDYNVKLAPRRKVLGQLAAARKSAEKDIDIYKKQIEYYERKIYGISWVSNRPYLPGDVVKYVTTQSKECWYMASGIIHYGTPPATSGSNWRRLDFTKELGSFVISQLPISAQADYWAEQKRQINNAFYRKYYRFIQEATWTDEKYMDDNLYYYDAVKVSAQNAWPKTKYTIGVIDVSGIERLAAYKFKVGQKSYVEDTEFFGYDYVNVGDGQLVKTPKKKEVVISERTRNFDDPSKSTITIQTYKNQFEELFSKLTATTQSLQYASGEYQKAANAVEADGSIKIESLEQAFANNSFMLANASNQLVTWDSGRGIEVADAKNPLEITRITSGGIYVSNDGGISWQLGLSAGRGINTRLLTAGTISAEHVNIRSKDGSNAFVWTEDGLTAFAPSSGGSKYVRFNDYGLFGTIAGGKLDNEVKNATSFEAALAAIRANSTFSLTWDGLLLNYQEGATSLSQKGGFEVFNNAKGSDWIFKQEYIDKYHPCTPEDGTYKAGDPIPIVSLGRYWTSAEENLFGNKIQTYGLRMRNKNGEITLDTDGVDGSLWLRKTLNVGYDKTLGVMAGINGEYIPPKEDENENEETSDAPNPKEFAFWAGGSKYSFYVTHSGRLKANDVDLTGTINATSGEFFGNISAATALFRESAWIGQFDSEVIQNFIEKENLTDINSSNIEIEKKWSGYRAGINSAPGFDGQEITPYAFWSGPEIEQRIEQNPESGNYFYTYRVMPNFSIDYNGVLKAKNAQISGIIEAGDGSTFHGTVYADNGSFTGDITANSGQINRLNLGENSYISGTQCNFNDSHSEDNDYYAVNIYNGNYLIDKKGNSYGAIGYFSLKENSDSGKATNYLVHIGVDNKPLQIFSPNGFQDDNNNEVPVLSVDNEGNVNIAGSIRGAGNLYLSKNLTLNNGKIILSDQANTKMIIEADSTGGKIFASSRLGSGWSIDSNGNAEFNNIVARGKIQTSVFEKQHITGIGGKLLITPSIHLSNSYDPNKGIEVDASWTGVLSAKVANTNQIPVSKAVKVVESIKDGKTIFLLYVYDNEKYDAENPENNVPATLGPGAVIMSEDDSRCSITLSAENTSNSGPSIVMKHTGENEDKTKVEHQVVIGSLADLSDIVTAQQYFGKVEGYGLYADNAYLTGKLYLPNAGITNEDKKKNDSSIRFWAGASAENMTSAPFIVTQDGSLYATKGVFSGKVMARHSSFSGVISASDLVLSNRYDVDDEKENQSFTIRWADKPWDDDGHSISESAEQFDIARFEASGLSIFRDLEVKKEDGTTLVKVINSNESSLANKRLLVSNLQVTNYYAPESEGISSINIKPTIVSFIKRAKDYELNELWDSASISMGIFDDGCAGISAGKITFTSEQKHENAALIIEPGFSQGGQTSAKTTLKGTLQFDEVFEVKTVVDGLIFNYTGTE